jgi:3'(2'), 5'-bisphosphate nucleotidase
MSLNALAQTFGQICLEAAIPVMEVYESDFTPEQKADKSPVTEADKRAEVIILDALSKLLPDTPVLAEESFEAGVRPSVSDEFLLVDPVDGTKEFIAKRGEFTINIGPDPQGRSGGGRCLRTGAQATLSWRRDCVYGHV